MQKDQQLKILHKIKRNSILQNYLKKLLSKNKYLLLI